MLRFLAGPAGCPDHSFERPGGAAFDILVPASNRENVKLRDIAQDIVETRVQVRTARPPEDPLAPVGTSAEA